MNARPRLLFLASEFTHGGSALLALRHVQRLASRYAIDVIVTGPAEPALLAALPAGVSVFPFRPRRRRLAARLWLAREPLAAWHRLPRRPPFDRTYAAAFLVLGLPDWRAAMLLGQIAARRRFAFLTDHSLTHLPFHRPRERAALGWGLSRVDRFLPVSAALWEDLRARCPLLAGHRHRVLPPPLAAADASAAPPPSPYPADGVPVVLTISRLIAGKNLAVCLRTHARLRADGLDFRWFVVGDGPDAARLRAEAAGLGLAGVFHFVGRQPSIEPWLRHCDVFAFFSEREGCPTVVREALAAGRPVLVNTVHGVHEMIDPGRTGIIVDPDDSAIAAGLARLLQDAALRDTLRRNLAMSDPVSDPARESAALVDLIEAPPAPSTPRVSILIATHNHAGFIERAIASALAQDFPDLEVVVSDDASTDETAARAQAWTGDPRFHYHRNATRLGHTANYRRLLGELARGDWVLMLDGDDYLLDPGFIRQTLAALDAHPGRRLVFAQAGQRVQPADDRPAFDVLPPIDAPAAIVSGGDYLRLLAGPTPFFNHLGTLYDRRAALAIDFYSAPVSASDQDSLLRLALEGDVLLLRTVAGCWVHHGANLSDTLPLADVAPNVRILRSVVDTATRRGLVSAAALEPALTRYEAATLAHLCGLRLAGSPPRLRTLFRLFAVIVAVNPRLFFQPAVLRLHYEFLCLLTGFPPRHPLALATRRMLQRLRRPSSR